MANGGSKPTSSVYHWSFSGVQLQSLMKGTFQWAPFLFSAVATCLLNEKIPLLFLFWCPLVKCAADNLYHRPWSTHFHMHLSSRMSQSLKSPAVSGHRSEMKRQGLYVILVLPTIAVFQVTQWEMAHPRAQPNLCLATDCLLCHLKLHICFYNTCNFGTAWYLIMWFCCSNSIVCFYHSLQYSSLLINHSINPAFIRQIIFIFLVPDEIILLHTFLVIQLCSGSLQGSCGIKRRI